MVENMTYFFYGMNHPAHLKSLVESKLYEETMRPGILANY